MTETISKDTYAFFREGQHIARFVIASVKTFTDRDVVDERVQRLTGIDLSILRRNVQSDSPPLSPDLVIGCSPSGEAIRLRQLTRSVMTYIEYYSSREWTERSRQAKIDAGWECELCGCSDRPLEAHHKAKRGAYKRIPYEEAKDLIVLCAPCHKLVHHVLSLSLAQMRLPFTFTPKRPTGAENN